MQKADEVGQDVFVETNGAVVKFYNASGFKVKARIMMSGGLGYEEYIMIWVSQPPNVE